MGSIRYIEAVIDRNREIEKEREERDREIDRQERESKREKDANKNDK